MTKTTLRIEGMSCQHCVMRVRKAIAVLPGVTDSEVNVGTAEIAYDEARISTEELKRAVEEAGYKVIEQTVER